MHPGSAGREGNNAEQLLHSRLLASLSKSADLCVLSRQDETNQGEVKEEEPVVAFFLSPSLSSNANDPFFLLLPFLAVAGEDLNRRTGPRRRGTSSSSSSLPTLSPALFFRACKRSAYFFFFPPCLQTVIKTPSLSLLLHSCSVVTRLPQRTLSPLLLLLPPSCGDHAKVENRPSVGGEREEGRRPLPPAPRQAAGIARSCPSPSPQVIARPTSLKAPLQA